MTILRKMKKSGFFGGHSLFAAAALALVFAFSSCESGLGEAVDTLAPMVTITGPDSSAVLSGPFEVKGTCVDDKGVAKVVVTVTNTESGEEVGMYAAESGLDSWTLRLNELQDGAYPLKDGSYSVNAVCFDTAGRKSGVASRVFDIDNTAPIFCLTKPNSLNISDPAAYGRDVVIRGEIADDHPIKQMDIRVFKWQDGAATEITSSLAKTTFSGFETAGGSEIPIAKFYPDSEIPAAGSENYSLYLNYKAMYTDLGAQVGDTVSLFVFPYLTDAAGNKSDRCYIQSALKQLVSKACSVDTTSDSLQTAQLKKIVNGSYNLGELSVETMRQILSGQYDQSASGTDYLYYASLPQGANPDAAAKTMLALSLNANNSPMYEFGGYSVDRSALSFAEIASEGQLSVKVAAGLDGNEIVANTVRVYLWECSDTLKLNKGLDINDTSTASLSSDNDDPAKKVTVTVTTLENGQAKEVETKDLGDEYRVSNATFKVTLPQMAAGTHYILKADGSDTAGNRFYSGVEYALMIATTGDSPRVEFADQFFVNAKALAKPADPSQAAPYSAKIQITDKSGEDKMGTLWESDNWVKATVSLYSGCAKSKANLADLQLFETMDELTFAGQDIKSDSERDPQTQKPKDGEYYIEIPLNKFDLQAYSAANYTIALQVQAKNTGAWSEATTYIFWADKTPPVLEVKAPARKSSDGSYYICRETDGSEIHKTTETVTNPQSGETTTTTKYEYTPRGSWSDESGSGACELWYALTDGISAAPALAPVWTACADDAIAVDGTTYYAKQGDGIYAAQTTIAAGESVKGKYTLSPGSGWKSVSGAPKSASRANWNQSIPDILNSSGKTLSLVAVDQTGNFSAVASVDNIMFDFAPPAIALPAAQAYYTASDTEKEGADAGKYVFKIVASDLSGIKSLGIEAQKWQLVQPASDSQPAVYGYVTVAPGSFGYELAVNEDNTLATVKFAPAASDGKWRLEIKAQDKAERETSEAFAFAIDNAPPARTEHYVDSQNPDNKRMLTISLGSRQGDITEWYNSENLAIKGKFTEEVSGLARVEYTVTAPLKEGQSEPDKQSGSEAQAGTSGAVEYTISPLGFAEGVNTIEIKGVDKAGNACASESYSINIDATSPLASASWYTYDGSNLTEAAGTALTNGEVPMTVYGTLEDKSSGIKSAQLWIGKPDPNKSPAASGDQVLFTTALGLNQGADDAAKKATFTGASWLPYSDTNFADKTAITGFKAVIPADALKSAESGDAELYAVVEDLAGNKTEQRKFLIHLDKTAPEIIVRSPAPGSVLNGTVAFGGTASDPALNSVKAYWKIGGDWQPIDSLTGTYNWKIDGFELSKAVNNVDATSGLNKGAITFADGTTYTGSAKAIGIKIVAADKAGNTAESVATYTINPDKDRPKITLTTANLAGMTLDNCAPHSSNRLEGTVEDDDGIDSLECSVSAYVYDDAEDGWKWKDWTAFEAVNVIGGSWKYYNEGDKITLPDGTQADKKLDDGKYRVRFRVTDKAGTIFTSTTAAGGEGNIDLSPKIAGTNGSIGPMDVYGRDVDTNLYLKVDTERPKREAISYYVWNSDQKKYVAEAEPTMLDTMGGDRKLLRVTFDAKDENGITEVKIKLNGKEYGSKVQKVDANGNPVTDAQGNPVYYGKVGALASGKYPCEIEDIDVSALESGIYSAVLTITGSYPEDSSNENIAINVDNKKPDVQILSPDSINAVFGAIMAYGTVDGADSMQYALSVSGTESPGANYNDELDDTDAQGHPIKKTNRYGGSVKGMGTMWRVKFDNADSTESESHAYSFEKFIIDKELPAVCSDGETRIATEDNIKKHLFDPEYVPLYLWIRAKDEVGNVCEKAFEIKFDPQGGRPSLFFTNLAETGTTRIGGKVKLYGSANSVEDEVKAVFLQFIWKEEHYLNADTTPKYEGGRGGDDGSGWGSVTRNESAGQVTKVTPTKNTWDYMTAAGYTVVNMNGAKDAQGKYLGFDPEHPVKWVAGSGTDATPAADAPDYAILADYKGGAWSLTINEKKEFDYVEKEDAEAETAKVNNVYVCGYSYNGEKFSLPIIKTIVVDADNPMINNMQVRRVSSSGKVEYSKAYTKGVYVNGDCNLEFDLLDNDDIHKVYMGQGTDAAEAKKDALDKKSDDLTESAVIPSWLEDKGTDDQNFKKFHAKFSLGTGEANKFGSKYLYLLFYDIKGNSSEQAFEINYDNKAPVISSVTMSDEVCDKDGYYSVEAKVTEENAAGSKSNQSGFDRFVVYFTRTMTVNGVEKTYIYDPMISKKKSNKIDVTGLTLGEDGLYWIPLTLQVDGNGKVVRDEKHLDVITILNDNPQIHAGRAVKMGGVLYNITNVKRNAGSTELTLSDSVELDVTEAYFAYGNVIDNRRGESIKNPAANPGDTYGYGYGYPSGIANDDDDGMVESVNVNGTSSVLEAYIKSRNIPDGKIDIHYTAFDGAGNYAKGIVQNAKVDNNSPRLANVIVKTDFNYNGSFDDEGESRAFYEGRALGSTEWENADKTLDLGSAATPFIAAKGEVIVTPEILGGNGALTWGWTYPNPTGSGRTAGVTHVDGGEKTSQTLYEAVENENELRKSGGALKDITLLSGQLKKAKGGQGLYIVKILDETEGGAQEAVINLYMKNDVMDAETPVAKTKRFYWKDLNDNSVDGSQSAQNQLDLQGHIELEKTFNDPDTGALNANPKVSGKVVIKGTAFDNAGIKELNLALPGILNSATTVAVCNFADAEGNPVAVGSRWAMQTAASGSGYEFSLDAGSERYTNTGHFVSWTLKVDTQACSFDGFSAKKDVNFVLGIVDKNGNVSRATTNTMTVYATAAQASAGKYYAESRFAAADTSAGYAKADYSADEFAAIESGAANADNVNSYSATPVDANYKMDIVPYITKVSTVLSAVNNVNGVTDRSSLGHYPIYNYKNSTSTGLAEGDKETVTINGFNLKGAKYGSVSLGGSTNNAGTLASDKIASGAFELSVNGVKTLNNANNNNASGLYSQTTSAAGGSFAVYKNYINRQPNNENNNNLTDDIAFDVWQLNNKAAAPMYGKVEDPQMKINPQDGKIGFAFSNSSSAFTMPNSTYSWTYWNYGYTGIKNTSLAYDPAGYAWAAATGQDVNGSNGDAFYLESNHWREQGGRTYEENGVVKSKHTFQDTTIYAASKLERLSVTKGDDTIAALDRIQSPSMAATKNGLYMAYYDKVNQTVNYRAGKLTGNFADDFKYEDKMIGHSNSSDIWAPETLPSRHWDFKNGFFKDQANKKTGTYETDTVPYVQFVATGVNPCVSIAAISGPSMENDIVVMVWNQGGQIKYARTVGDPMAKTSGKLTATWKDSYSGAAGSTRTLFSGKITSGEALCKVAVDAEGGVHVAACDSNNLYYAYMETPNSDPVEARVDSYNNTGDFLTIDVALAADSTSANPKPIPQIGFYSAFSGRPKYARWNPKAGNIRTMANIDGCDSNDVYTGKWEVTNIPTTNFILTSEPGKVKQNINVGVWKDEDGLLTVSTTGTSFCKTGQPDDNLNAENYGDVYGNGTANAVLSYMYGSTSEGFIETAQRLGEYDE